jgi:hypothetical protein
MEFLRTQNGSSGDTDRMGLPYREGIVKSANQPNPLSCPGHERLFVGHPTTSGSLASLRADTKTHLWPSGKLWGAFPYRFFKILAYFDQMVETRIAFRHRVLKTATIKFGGDSIDYVVRDLSTTGAALEVSSPAGITAKFTLVIPGDAISWLNEAPEEYGSCWELAKKVAE